jgi:hypothetical protein
MSELHEMWSEMLAAARENARAAGRGDVADYLDLKASNDLLRRAGVEWLTATLTGFAAEANRENRSIAIERSEPHSFAFHGANMVGHSLELRYGVRRLTLEAGWTRTPGDGFMRGGALAFARFRHFGMPHAALDAALFHAEASDPVWRAVKNDLVGSELRAEHLRRHLDILLRD